MFAIISIISCEIKLEAMSAGVKKTAIAKCSMFFRLEDALLKTSAIFLPRLRSRLYFDGMRVTATFLPY